MLINGNVRLDSDASKIVLSPIYQLLTGQWGIRSELGTVVKAAQDTLKKKNVY